MPYSREKTLGVMLVSRAGRILETTVPALLDLCRVVMLMIDNADRETMFCVLRVCNTYPGRVLTVDSGFDDIDKSLEDEPHEVYRRFREIQPFVRERAIREAEKIVEREGLEAVIWPDSDEIMCRRFGETMTAMLDSGMDAISTIPADVYGDMSTLMSRTMGYHIRAFRWVDGITALPWNGACRYHPFGPDDTLLAPREVIHLAMLTPENREFRSRKWARNSKVPSGGDPLWSLGKDVRECLPEEIISRFKEPPDLTVAEYHEKHG